MDLKLQTEQGVSTYLHAFLHIRPPACGPATPARTSKAPPFSQQVCILELHTHIHTFMYIYVYVYIVTEVEHTELGERKAP